MPDGLPALPDVIDELSQTLNRDNACDSLTELVSALKKEARTAALADTAIGIDTNIFLRLATRSDGADIIDYLAERHLAPVILPGQAIQEFWNNHLQAVDTIGTKVRKEFERFRSDLSDADPIFDDYAKEISAVLDRFVSEHGFVFEESVGRKTFRLLEILQGKATVPYAPRTPLAAISALRRRTRTPPSFKDDGDGDFYIWADFLYGLRHAQRSGNTFTKAVLVTNDKKADWSRESVAHPILTAEVRGLLNVPFEIWTPERLAKEIREGAA